MNPQELAAAIVARARRGKTVSPETEIHPVEPRPKGKRHLTCSRTCTRCGRATSGYRYCRGCRKTAYREKNDAWAQENKPWRRRKKKVSGGEAA